MSIHADKIVIRDKMGLDYVLMTYQLHTCTGKSIEFSVDYLKCGDYYKLDKGLEEKIQEALIAMFDDSDLVADGDEIVRVDYYTCDCRDVWSANIGDMSHVGKVIPGELYDVTEIIRDNFGQYCLYCYYFDDLPVSDDGLYSGDFIIGVYINLMSDHILGERKYKYDNIVNKVKNICSFLFCNENVNRTGLLKTGRKHV